MHIHFIGIGGAGIGPLAQVALGAGYEVSGSDLISSPYTDYLLAHGIDNIKIGQPEEILTNTNSTNPIDWLVYTSALTVNETNPPALVQARALGIRATKRDEFLNHLLKENNQQLIAIAGTHGKTTTTAMVVWLFKSLNIPVSYLLPAKVSYGEMGEFNKAAKHFIYEADEFDRNFLSFHPSLSLISGVTWDHHEIYPSREDYIQAFKDFISQSKQTILWQPDTDYLQVDSGSVKALDESDHSIDQIKLKGLYNRRDAYLAVKALSLITGMSEEDVTKHIDSFPGLSRRMEEIAPGLYSDYAHTPEKIKAAINTALEMVEGSGRKLIIVYEPLTNRRQKYIKKEYKNCFNGATKVYWLPSYLAREEQGVPIISPDELISELNEPNVAVSATKNDQLKDKIRNHLDSGDVVVGLAGGGGGSLDDWLREQFAALS